MPNIKSNNKIKRMINEWENETQKWLELLLLFFLLLLVTYQEISTNFLSTQGKEIILRKWNKSRKQRDYMKQSDLINLVESTESYKTLLFFSHHFFTFHPRVYKVYFWMKVFCIVYFFFKSLLDFIFVLFFVIYSIPGILYSWSGG